MQNGNYNNSQNNNYGVNQNNNRNNNGQGKSNNTVMVVIISVLSTIAVITTGVFIFMLLGLSGKDEEKTPIAEQSELVMKKEQEDEDSSFMNEELTEENKSDEEEYIERELYVEETDKEDESEFEEEELLIEEVEESTVWYENEEGVKDFVEDVLYGYVDSINTGDFNKLSQYLSGPVISEALETHNKITKLVDTEIVQNVECYNVTPISENKVTVMRESTITLYKKDGTVRDVTETYLTTVEYINGEMKVTKFQYIDKKIE